MHYMVLIHVSFAFSFGCFCFLLILILVLWSHIFSIQLKSDTWLFGVSCILFCLLFVSFYFFFVLHPPWPRKWIKAKRDKACTWTRNLRLPASSSLFFSCWIYHMLGKEKKSQWLRCEYMWNFSAFVAIIFLGSIVLISLLFLLWVIRGRNERVFPLG